MSETTSSSFMLNCAVAHARIGPPVFPLVPGQKVIDAYRCDIGEEVSPIYVIHVWRPGEADRFGLTEDAAVTADVRGYWKGPADLRASGTTWVRDHSGRIRNAPVSAGGCRPFQPSPPPPAVLAMSRW